MNIYKLSNYSIFMFCIFLPINSFALKYQPYEGFEGYQEIKIMDDIYFVAFHGEKNSAGKEVKAAWGLRSAQLCSRNGSEYFAPLKYSFERILYADPELLSKSNKWDGAYFKVGGEFIYIPMYTPGPDRNASINAPTRQSHIRCISKDSEVIDKERLIEVQPIIDDGISRGWITK